MAAPNISTGPTGTRFALNGQYFNAAGDPIGNYAQPGSYNPQVGAYNTDINYGKPTPTGPTQAQIDAANQAAQNAALAAGYDQKIGNYNFQLGLLPGQQSNQQQAIENAYNDALNQLAQTKARSQTGYDTASSQALQDYTQGKQQATSGYNTAKTQSGQDYVASKNTIAANAGNSLNGLLRLLGSRGAGGGSAYNVVAPGAVARQATLQRGDVGQTFGRNQQALDTSYNTGLQGLDQTYGRNKNALDTNWQNYLHDYGTSLDQLAGQKTNNTNALQASIDQSQADLLQQIGGQTSLKLGLTQPGAQAIAGGQPFYDQANQLYAAATALGKPTAVNIQANPANYVAPALAAQTPYVAPSLDKYITGTTTPTLQGQPQVNDYTSPWLAGLLGKKQQNTAATPVGG